MLIFLYHSRLDLAIRGQLGDGDSKIVTSVYLLGSAIHLRLETVLGRNKEGKLYISNTLNEKPWHIKKRKPPKKQGKLKIKWKLPNKAKQYLVRNLKLTSLGFSVTLGVASNAATTALLCGLTLTLLESLASIVRAIKPHARVLMRSAPDYRKDCLKTRFSCIASIKIGHIMIIAAIAALYSMKGAIAAWLTQLRTSCAPPWKTSRT